MKTIDYYLNKLSEYGFEFPNLPIDVVGSMEVKDFPTQKKLYVDGKQWMGLNLMDYREVFQFLSHIENSRGKVITTGMGFLLRESWLVKKGFDVTVLEINKDIIDYHLKHNPDICSKLTIINCNAEEYRGSCDTLLLDHYELETNEYILDSVIKFKERINYSHIWFWPIERLVVSQCRIQGIGEMESYLMIKDQVQGLPDLSSPSLDLYLTIWKAQM
jgi:hypothetical protein